MYTFLFMSCEAPVSEIKNIIFLLTNAILNQLHYQYTLHLEYLKGIYLDFVSMKMSHLTCDSL